MDSIAAFARQNLIGVVVMIMGALSMYGVIRDITKDRRCDRTAVGVAILSLLVICFGLVLLVTSPGTPVFK